MPLDSSRSTRFAQFHTTRGSVGMRVQSPAMGAADESLESLCRQYRPPLYTYVRRRGHPTYDAQDLTQGKLRSFLLAAMKRFPANEWDHPHAAKRGGLHAITSMDTEEGKQLLVAGIRRHLAGRIRVRPHLGAHRAESGPSPPRDFPPVR